MGGEYRRHPSAENFHAGEKQEKWIVASRDFLLQIEELKKKIQALRPTLEELAEAKRHYQESEAFKNLEETSVKSEEVLNRPKTRDSENIDEAKKRFTLKLKKIVFGKKMNKDAVRNLNKARQAAFIENRKDLNPVYQKLQRELHYIPQLSIHQIPVTVIEHLDLKDFTETVNEINRQLSSPKEFSAQDVIVKLAKVSKAIDKHLLDNDPSDERLGLKKPKGI